MYRVGIDLGGTNIVAGVVDDNFHILATAKRKTNAPRPADAVADDMAAVVFEAIEKAGLTVDDVAEFGIGTPGSVNPEKGIIGFANNLQFRDVELVRMMKERVGKDFYMENDANAAAYGEFIAGAGKGAKNFIAVTLGTGVGGGIVIDGKIYAGTNHAGGELGHSTIALNGIPCSCGRIGCWEAYASATALINQTKEAMQQNKDSLMWEICGGDLNNVNGLTSFDAMRKGDAAGTAVVKQYCDYVAVGISNIVHVFQPDVICIGGGISKEGDTLIQPINEYILRENYAREIAEKGNIKVAALGNDAGIIGAAFLGDLYR